MVKLRITKQGEVNKQHGHEWDKIIGMVTSALSKHKGNAFYNDKRNEVKKRKKSKKPFKGEVKNESNRTDRKV